CCRQLATFCRMCLVENRSRTAGMGEDNGCFSSPPYRDSLCERRVGCLGLSAAGGRAGRAATEPDDDYGGPTYAGAQVHLPSDGRGDEVYRVRILEGEVRGARSPYRCAAWHGRGFEIYRARAADRSSRRGW